MDSKFSFYFETCESLIRETTYTDGNQKYLLASLNVCNFWEIENPRTYLIIPDDNSLLTNHVKNNPNGDDVFVTPLSNLKYKPDFWRKSSQILNSLLFKDTSQVKKIVGTERPKAEITFQVISQQKKTKGANPDPKNYNHELVVKPFSLGVEGIPEISQIIFKFTSLAPGQKEVEKGIIKTELYNSKLLAESAGKTFSMEIKRWRWEASKNALSFENVNDLDISSFKEKTGSDDPLPIPNQNDNPPPPNSSENSGNSSGNKGLMIAVITILVVLVLSIGFLVVRKRKPKNKR